MSPESSQVINRSDRMFSRWHCTSPKLWFALTIGFVSITGESILSDLCWWLGNFGDMYPKQLNPPIPPQKNDVYIVFTYISGPLDIPRTLPYFANRRLASLISNGWGLPSMNLQHILVGPLLTSSSRLLNKPEGTPRQKVQSEPTDKTTQAKIIATWCLGHRLWWKPNCSIPPISSCA